MLQKTPRTLVYLTAAELGITERERAGLIEVRDDLASGRVKHVMTGARYPSRTDVFDINTSWFNMNEWANTYKDCGTVHCIGGFMKARGAFFGQLQYSTALHRLFNPVKVRGWCRLSVVQAVRAIDLFLAGAGDDCWPLALSDEPA